MVDAGDETISHPETARHFKDHKKLGFNRKNGVNDLEMIAT